MPAKTFTPGLPDAQDITMEPQGPKVVAPTPEQITAIKVHAFSRNIMKTACSCPHKFIENPVRWYE